MGVDPTDYLISTQEAHNRTIKASRLAGMAFAAYAKADDITDPAVREALLRHTPSKGKLKRSCGPWPIYPSASEQTWQMVAVILASMWEVDNHLAHIPGVNTPT